jgi:hypothetical protein
MRVIILVGILALLYFASCEKKCTPDDCKAPNCTCLSDIPPFNHSVSDVPQFIIMTFDEAVRVTNYPTYANLSNFKNPNGCPIQATFFVSHVDTNYKLVHELHRRGHEIASHSISKNPLAETWKKMNLETWKKEMGGVKRIISKLAEIPINEIIGARAPGLQTAANVTFTALVEEGFKYECSMPSRKYIKHPIYPYTLDYGFQRYDDCQIRPCLEPDQNYPGFWTVPMNDWITEMSVEGTNKTYERECASVDGCILFNKDGTANYDPTVEQIAELFEINFQRFYNTTRAPFPFFLREAWLSGNVNRQIGLMKFIEKMTQKKDVFFVSISEVIDWMGRGANATSIHDYKQTKCLKSFPKSDCTIDPNEPIATQGHQCKFEKIPELSNQDKTLVVCDKIKCPQHYPWVGNDAGN